MYRTAISQSKRMLALAPLLAVLFALLPHYVAAQKRHAAHASVRLLHGHKASVAATHALFTPNTHRLQPPAKQFKAHTAASRHLRRTPVSAHHYVAAVLHARAHHSLGRHTVCRDPLACHPAPNAPPIASDPQVTSSLLSALTTYRLQVCLLRPCLGRAPPRLL